MKSQSFLNNSIKVQKSVTPESLVNVLGVIYVHRKTSDGGDIYLTRFGLPVAEFLELENWYEKEWFEKHRERLEGTSSVYRVPTKELYGESIELVVKNSRVGEDVPLETKTLLEYLNAEFNSPWEEFSLVFEMLEGKFGPPDIKVNTQEPLAIYVPPEKMQIWQSGRSQVKINRIRARQPGIDIDILRQYKLIYRWIKGKNVLEAFQDIGFSNEELREVLGSVTRKSISDMEKKGYVVADMKPVHIIIGEKEIGKVESLVASTEPDTRRLRSEMLQALIRQGNYSVIDYELLLRTDSHEEQVSSQRRHSYLDDQRDRFTATELPSHLTSMEILGVPYVHGHVESTNGQLWVVGKNGRLFDYFLPERWRKTHAWRLSAINDVYYTVTKDHIHIVWKTSNVGERPSLDFPGPHAKELDEFGYNSPFEEFSIAHHLSLNGVPTVYMRAIYMTGSAKLEITDDMSRYISHSLILGPDGYPVLRPDRNYITLRGYYNGPDEWVAKQNGPLCRPLDLLQATGKGIVDESLFNKLFDKVKSQLKNVGYDGTFLRKNDLLLAVDPNKEFILDKDGLPEVRICNCELIRKI
ncbi:MAG TPA: hypothetical protein PLE24_05695 [Chitinispirillaceae bacterium]|nr:hypothetical protein [Chitinispirillaceae bacterium]